MKIFNKQQPYNINHTYDGSLVLSHAHHFITRRFYIERQSEEAKMCGLLFQMLMNYQPQDKYIKQERRRNQLGDKFISRARIGVRWEKE